MPQYNFVAKNKKGELVRNSLQASSRYEAIALVKQRGLEVISVKLPALEPTEKKHSFVITLLNNAVGLFKSNRITLNEVAIFCRQLSTCITAGISLIESLEVIADDIENHSFKNIICQVTQDVREGKYFSEALKRHEKVFGKLTIAIIRAAEESGSMPKALEELAASLEKNVRLLRKIRSVTAYPLFVTLFFTVVIFIVTIFVIPRFESMFLTLGSDLPSITKIVFYVNRFMIDNMLIFIISGFLAVVFIYIRTDRQGFL